jgi:hypothetical protein
MNMNDVVRQAEQVGDDLDGVARVVNIVGFGTAIPGKVDDGAVKSMTSKVLADGNQVTLHATVGRGKWA